MGVVNDDRRPRSPLEKMMKPGAIDNALGGAVGLMCRHDLQLDWPPIDPEGLLLTMAQSIVSLVRHAEAQAELLCVEAKPKGKKATAGLRAWHVPPPREEMPEMRSG
jgi:hypothetical protein